MNLQVEHTVSRENSFWNRGKRELGTDLSRKARAAKCLWRNQKKPIWIWAQFIHANARRIDEMKISLLLLLLVVRGPLLSEENSLLGYRLDWNNSKGNVRLKCLERSRKKGFPWVFIRFTLRRLVVSRNSPQVDIYISCQRDTVLGLANSIVGFLTW